MLGWLTRCLPGFSLIGLTLLLLCAFTDILQSPLAKKLLPQPPISSPGQEGPWSGLVWPQRIFIIYTLWLHVHTLAFTLRLVWSILTAIRSTREVLQRRLETSPISSPQSPQPVDQLYSDQPISPVSLSSPSISPYDKKNFVSTHELTEKELVHAIILPNYSEDLHTLETTLRVLASHPRAKSQYEVRPQIRR